MQVILPEDVETRLDLLSKKTGRSKDSYICEALKIYLEDVEDYHLARERLESPGKMWSQEEIERELGIDVAN